MRESRRKSLTSLLGDQRQAPGVCVCVDLTFFLPARFHLCASQGRLDCLEVIIAHGADLTVPESAGRRPEAVGPLGVLVIIHNGVFTV